MFFLHVPVVGNYMLISYRYIHQYTVPYIPVCIYCVLVLGARHIDTRSHTWVEHGLYEHEHEFVTHYTLTHMYI